MLSTRELDQLRDLLGKRIREMRKLKHLTQEQLAGRLLMERSRLSRIERGSRSSTFDELALVAEEFDLSLSELLWGIDLSSCDEGHMPEQQDSMSTRERGIWFI